MIEYNRQQMIRLINRNIELQDEYMEDTETDPNDKLKEIFETRVRPDKSIALEYAKLSDRKVILLPDSPAVAEIRMMVRRMGWRGFIEAVSEYASQKETEMKIMGLYTHEKVWEGIKDKVGSVRKRVQL
jgi:hypothetical protein